MAEGAEADLAGREVACPAYLTRWYPYAGAVAAALVACGFPLLLPPTVARWSFPLTAAAFVYPFFLGLVRANRHRKALLAGLVWAAACTVCVTALTLLFRSGYGRRILNGEEYRSEMFLWVTTGIGAESDPSRFLPQHALHFCLFTVLSSLSIGFLGLAMGSALLNYMNYYYGMLILQSGNHWGAALLGWPIWAILRVVGYVFIGVAAAEIGVSILFRRRRPAWNIVWRFFWPGIALVACDVILKAMLAPVWQSWLGGFFGIEY